MCWRVDDASSPGGFVAALETHFEPIDKQADAPHYKPLFGSAIELNPVLFGDGFEERPPPP